MSELLDAAGVTTSTDKNGNPLNKDGTVRIIQQTTDPFPTDFGPAEDGAPNNQMGVLLNLQNKYYPGWQQQIYIDGAKYGQPGTEPGFHLMTKQTPAGVKLIAVEAPLMNQVRPITVLAPDSGQDMTIQLPWPDVNKEGGSIKYPPTSGWGTKKLKFKWVMPKQPKHNINTVGSVEFYEFGGQVVLSRTVQVWVNGKEIVPKTEVGSYANIPFTVNNPEGWKTANAGFNLNDGETLEIELTTPGLAATGYASADIKAQVNSPVMQQTLV